MRALTNANGDKGWNNLVESVIIALVKLNLKELKFGGNIRNKGPRVLSYSFSCYIISPTIQIHHLFARRDLLEPLPIDFWNLKAK